MNPLCTSTKLILVLLGISALALLAQSSRDIITGVLYNERTVYAPDYKDSNFRSIRAGDSKDAVIEVLGLPLQTRKADRRERWTYRSIKPTQKNGIWPYTVDIVLPGSPNQFTSLEFSPRGTVVASRGSLLGSISAGATQADIEHRFGTPDEILPGERGVWLEYSSPRNGTNKTHKVRRILIDESGKVSKIDNHLWVD